MTLHHPYHPMNPHPGICSACRTVPGYWDASPDGERLLPASDHVQWVHTVVDRTGAPTTANYSLLTANTTVAPPAPQAHPILHSAFCILHWTYTFSAKEKDSETGLSYFGSRYYSSDLSIWLSVDPMSDKYPSLSPYVYCADNSVKLVDPNGDTIINAYKDAYDYFLQQYNLAKEKYINIDNNKDPIEYSNVKNEYDKASRDLEDISNFYKTTEVAISNVKKYNKQLYDQMNNIKDDKGNAVDIIVTVNYNIDKYGNHTIPINHVCPTSIIVQLNPIANFYEYKDMGEVLSHEFGHLLYIIPHWSDYQKFLETVGTNHNGHNYGDKSGEYADEQTQIYIHNKLFSR